MISLLFVIFYIQINLINMYGTIMLYTFLEWDNMLKVIGQSNYQNINSCLKLSLINYEEWSINTEILATVYWCLILYVWWVYLAPFVRTPSQDAKIVVDGRGFEWPLSAWSKISSWENLLKDSSWAVIHFSKWVISGLAHVVTNFTTPVCLPVFH